MCARVCVVCTCDRKFNVNLLKKWYIENPQVGLTYKTLYVIYQDDNNDISGNVH